MKTKKESEKKLMKEVREGFKENIVLKTIKTDAKNKPLSLELLRKINAYRLIHRLTYRRSNQERFHVRGYKEEGTTTTPFDMVVLYELDRFHLVGDMIDRLPDLGSRVAYAKQFLRNKLLDHKKFINKYGQDMPEIRNRTWSNPK